MLFACSNTNVVFPKDFSKYPFHNKWKLIWNHWKQNIYSIIRGVLGTIRKRLVKTSCKAMLKLCLVANNFGTFGNTIETMGILLFCCIHSGERTASHDVVWDACAFIVKDVRFQILQKKTHVFWSPFFEFSCWQVDVVLLVDGICTWTNLVSWATLSCGVVTTMAALMKKRFYHNHYPMDVFLPLAIKVLRCFHQQVNNFFHRCINMVWTIKATICVAFLL